jgi:hypothetical protein
VIELRKHRVYILYCGLGTLEEGEIIGIFSTVEMAQSAAKRLGNNRAWERDYKYTPIESGWTNGTMTITTFAVNMLDEELVS